MRHVLRLLCFCALLAAPLPTASAQSLLPELIPDATLGQPGEGAPEAAAAGTAADAPAGNAAEESAKGAPPAAASDAAAAEPRPALTADTALADAQEKVKSWNAELDQAEAALQRSGLSGSQLDSLRTSVAGVRAASEEVQAALQPRAKSIERRVAELAPAENSTDEQSEAVTRQLAEQRQQLAELNGVLKQVQVAQLRADELLSRIAQSRRDQLTQRLLTPTPSILHPAFWTRVASDLQPTVHSANLLVGDWIGLIYAKAGAWAVLLVLLALVGAYVLIWPLRKQLLDRAARDPEAVPAPLRRSTAALAIALLATVVPAAALIILYRGLELFDLSPERVRLMLAAIFRGLVFAAFAQGLGRALIAPSRPTWRPLPIGDDAATRLSSLATAAGVTFALGLTLDGATAVLSISTDLAYAVEALVALLVASITIAALRTLARGAPTEEETREDVGGLSGLGRWLVPLFWLAALAALLAPVFGYIRFGWFVAQQIVWTISVLGVLHLLLLLVDDLAGSLFRAETALGRAMRDSMAISGGAIEQIGVLLSGVLRILLILVAAVSVLAPWGVSTDVTGLLRQALFGFQIGSFTFSLSEIVLALVIFVIGLTVTRAMQRWLESRFLPHTKLDVGLKASIRTGFGYVGVIIAGMVAFSYLGLDLQNIAIVAGALSVGIGFGLQSIVNNFVSGLILLAERPIKVGDWIVVGGEQGYVKRINVRATEVETFDRQTVIVPNSDLISGVVKNWMHNDTSGRIIVAVGVSYDSDPEQVRDILLGVARDSKELLAYPAPSVFFMDFGASSLDFELRGYLAQIDSALTVKSQLRFEITRRFREAGVEIPFPQRDLNLRDMDRLERALAGGPAPARQTETATPESNRAVAQGDSE